MREVVEIEDLNDAFAKSDENPTVADTKLYAFDTGITGLDDEIPCCTLMQVALTTAAGRCVELLNKGVNAGEPDARDIPTGYIRPEPTAIVMCRNPNYVAIQALLEHVDLSATDGRGNSVWHTLLTAELESVDKRIELLDLVYSARNAKAPLTSQNLFGQTPKNIIEANYSGAERARLLGWFEAKLSAEAQSEREPEPGHVRRPVA